MRAARLDRGEGLVGILGRPRAVAFVRQNAGHDVADVGFVVDDQNIARHWISLTILHRRRGVGLLRRAGLAFRPDSSPPPGRR